MLAGRPKAAALWLLFCLALASTRLAASLTQLWASEVSLCWRHSRCALLNRAVLTDEQTEAGRYEATLDAGALPSGSCLVRLTTDDGFAETQRITLLR